MRPFLYSSLALVLATSALAETPKVLRDLGDKIDELTSDPTPKPRPKKKSSPTPMPDASPRKSPPSSPAKARATPSETPEDEPEESPSPKKKSTASPSPSAKKKPSASPSPRKAKSSPTPDEDDDEDDLEPAKEEPGASPEPAASPGRTSTISAEQLKDFEDQPASVQKLIQTGLDLAGRGLGYTYGSADPSQGGMDCSGFIYYVLQHEGLKEAPRDSSGLYTWARKAGTFRAVVGRTHESFEFDELRPGDLLFWTGTYEVEKDPPVSHTMIYLGRAKGTGKPLMIGSSDGRTYLDEKRSGVSVFDFKMPKESSEGKRQPVFIGYARIPSLRD